MKTFSLFLLLAVSASAQIPTEYSLEATLEESRNEKTGQPVFLCSGTTNLHDGTILSAYLYYGKVTPGRDLRYAAVKVKEGAFLGTLPLYKDKTLSGTYLLHLRFNPYLQQRKIRQLMGEQVREYQTRVTLQIGDEEAYRADGKRVRKVLAGQIDILWKTGQDLRALLLEEPIREVWQGYVKMWEKRIRECVKACYDIPEYKALGIDDISERAMDDMSEALHKLIRAAGAHLGDRQNTEHTDAMTKMNRILDIIRHDCKRRLGLAFANEIERKRLLDTAKEGILMAGGLYTWLRRDPKATPVVYYARLEEFTKEFTHQIEQLLDGTPKKHHKLIEGLLDHARTVFQAVEEAPKSKTNPLKKIQAVVDQYLEFAEPVEARLKE